MNAPYPLSLSEIASWHPDSTVDARSPIVASIPALQRGLVWRPQQIEMLWDSILRGFPIGALVVCPKIQEQERGKDERVTHHLLDGQQRCNAIALGFSDPFPPERGTSFAASSIVWLDLCPKLDGNSTRDYLIRVTTMAHPWGYTKGDTAGPLPRYLMRAALEEIGRKPSEPGYRRPAPCELRPYEANAPIPLSWLMNAPLEEGAFWEHIRDRVRACSFLPWSSKVQRFLEDLEPAAFDQRGTIFRGISKARKAQILALNAPVELLEASHQERFAQEGQADISNIEHLFQRLNQQGTRLDGEELAYSLIKAYWPNLANPIDDIAKHRMPASRLVALGVRAALAEQDHLPAPLPISSLRALANGATAPEKEKKRRILSFIEGELGTACGLIDFWLRYDAKTNQTGLLPVHVTSLALRSSDVYLLLLCFAAQLLRDGSSFETHEHWRKPAQALASILHWFTPEKRETVNLIYQYATRELSVASIKTALRDAIQKSWVLPLHSPQAVRDFIEIPETGFEDWSWWKLIERDGNEQEREARHRAWWGFLDFRSNRELLLYAQREYIARRFEDYDPARKDLWEEQNRPWDYDHLSASKYLYYRKHGNFKGVCNEWQYTIGNLRAWPLEDNRADQDDVAEAKVGGDPLKMSDGFVEMEEIPGFSGGEELRHRESVARAYVEACRRRLLRIYDHWYESVGVNQFTM